MEIKSPLLAAATSVMLGLAMSSQAAITCTQDHEACFTDYFGVTFKVVPGTYPIAALPNPMAYDFGNLAGFMEIPKGLTGTVEDITCPLRGSYLSIGPGLTEGSSKRVQIGLYSDCFCDEGANPAHRVFQIDIDANGRPVGNAQPMTSHIYRCNNIYEVWSQEEPDFIGPATTIPPYDSISPDWDRESAY